MITLYWCPRTRAARALWMLEELGKRNGPALDPVNRAVEQAEALGFFFTGILPETADGDSIVLQYMNGIQVDYDHFRTMVRQQYGT